MDTLGERKYYVGSEGKLQLHTLTESSPC